MIIKSQKDVPGPFIEWSDGNFPDYIMKTVNDSKYSKPSSI